MSGPTGPDHWFTSIGNEFRDGQPGGAILVQYNRLWGGGYRVGGGEVVAGTISGSKNTFVSGDIIEFYPSMPNNGDGYGCQCLKYFFYPPSPPLQPLETALQPESAAGPVAMEDEAYLLFNEFVKTHSGTPAKQVCGGSTLPGFSLVGKGTCHDPPATDAQYRFEEDSSDNPQICREKCNLANMGPGALVGDQYANVSQGCAAYEVHPEVCHWYAPPPGHHVGGNDAANGGDQACCFAAAAPPSPLSPPSPPARPPAAPKIRTSRLQWRSWHTLLSADGIPFLLNTTQNVHHFECIEHHCRCLPHTLRLLGGL